MEYDIYGGPLKRGHCSVHPLIALEYPCPMCRNEQDDRDAQWQACKEHCQEVESEYWESVRKDHEESIKEETK